VLKQINRKESDVYVFTNAKTNKPFVNVFKPWDRIRSKAGLPQLRLHDLRHMYATYCVNNGCTIFEVSQLLGHADTRVSQRYSHLSTTTMLTAANSVSEKLSKFMVINPDGEKLDAAA
jgi:integrase